MSLLGKDCFMVNENVIRNKAHKVIHGVCWVLFVSFLFSDPKLLCSKEVSSKIMIIAFSGQRNLKSLLLTSFSPSE